ncbi:hypothetical protein BG011_009541 [Mortierella polycephala]|uniref:DUF1212-domain-containing protein n=1 Tax=Mortierella polycephala TaxID=41804 RepID=A0A9P6PMQ6_9FUNG|nr:hypothetical protein BG011_009541 [Mortierella polycephala]
MKTATRTYSHGPDSETIVNVHNHQRSSQTDSSKEFNSTSSTDAARRPERNVWTPRGDDFVDVAIQHPPADEPIETVTPLQTLFSSLKSVKAKVLRQVSGWRAEDEDVPSAQRFSNWCSTRFYRNRGQEKESQVPSSGSSMTWFLSSGLQTHGNQAEDITRKTTSHKSRPARSGGVLSNLLKLQALSMPSPQPRPSRHRRKRRSRQRRDRNILRSSVAPEIFLTSSASVALSGLVMVAPSGIDVLPNTASAYNAIVSPETSASINIPNGNNGLGISTPCNDAHRIPIGATSTLEPCEYQTESSRCLQAHQRYSARGSISADDDASIRSSISQDPLAAIRRDQQAELTEALADMLQQQDLLIRLCKSFIRYGAPSHRIELAMEAMCKTFGVDGSFAFLPGLMMISFGDPDTHTSETHLIKCPQGFDMGRLAKVNRIARALVYGHMQPGEALASLKEINAECKPYSTWVMLVSYALSSGLIAPLVFKGSWYDMLAGMGLGFVVGLMSLLANRYSIYSNLFEVSTSIVIAFVAKALRNYVCFTGVVLSGIVTLLPGLSLTTAIMELSSRHMISGSVRMFYSLIYCLFLGFGLSIGSNLWDVFKEPPPGDLKTGYCHPATEPWRWVLFPLLAMSFNVQLHALPRQWPVMVICSSVGYAVSECTALYWPHSLHIAATVSAFVVGLLGNIYERLTHELAFVPILGAILLIVPGGMGVRSSLLLLDQAGDAAQGTAFALQMIVVALGIAVGLFASTLVVYPLGKKRNALLTF